MSILSLVDSCKCLTRREQTKAKCLIFYMLITVMYEIELMLTGESDFVMAHNLKAIWQLGQPNY